MNGIEFYKGLSAGINNLLNYKNKLDISIKLNLILEKMIIKNPSQWIWTHNRWK